MGVGPAKEQFMGMIRIQMYGSFPTKDFDTSAVRGGHVTAIKRAIQFLTEQLGPAVIKDVQLTSEGIVPPDAPLGKDQI